MAWLCYMVFLLSMLQFGESRIHGMTGYMHQSHPSSEGFCLQDCVNGGIPQKSLLGLLQCKCSPFYSGPCCEIPKCILNGSLEQNECVCPPRQSGTFCENVDCGQGSLAMRNGIFFCECSQGFNGTYCENKVIMDNNYTGATKPEMVLTGYCYCFAHNAPQMFVVFTIFLTIIGIFAFLLCVILASRAKRSCIRNTRVIPEDCVGDLEGVYVCADSPFTIAKRAMKAQKDAIERQYFAIGYNHHSNNNDSNSHSVGNNSNARRAAASAHPTTHHININTHLDAAFNNENDRGKTPTPPPSYDVCTGVGFSETGGEEEKKIDIEDTV